MTPKIKNIIIFLAIGIILIIVYSYFIKGGSNEVAPLSSTANNPMGNSSAGELADQNSAIAQDFLALLLNVKGITLQDSIFSDPAFTSLKDSSIELVPDGNEGRPNPFAPIGTDVLLSINPSGNATSTTPSTNSGTNNTNSTPLVGAPSGSTTPAAPAKKTTN